MKYKLYDKQLWAGGESREVEQRCLWACRKRRKCLWERRKMKCSWALEKKCLWAYRKNEMFVGVKYKSDLIPVLETKKNEDNVMTRKLR